MSRFFMSYSHEDRRQAFALKRWLVDQDPPLDNEIFLDDDPHSGIRPGIRWKDALQQASTRCEAVICLLSPEWEASTECNTEFRTAENLRKKIFCVRLDPSTGKGITRDWQWVDLFGDGPMTQIDDGTGNSVAFSTAGLDRLRREIVGAGIGPETFVWPPPKDPDRAPYRGWASLEEVDAAVFFGRDSQLVRGLDALRGMRLSGVDTLFVILGPSGAGKSSFLRAGLLPRLRRDDRSFVALDIVRPERDVLTGDNGLAQSIHAAYARMGLSQPPLADIKQACLGDTIRVGVLLHEIQQAAMAKLVDVPEGAQPPTLVLPVDQAEELFGVDAGPEAQRFLEMIGQHAGAEIAQRVQLIVAVTIRTDRHEALETAPTLARVKSVVFDDLKPLPAAEFKEVIVGPARRATDGGRPLRIESALVEQLLQDCTEGGDTLPLLALTLARLFINYGSDGDLKLDEYNDMGGMRNVVQTEIDSLLSRDDATRREQLDQLRRAFVPWLATINPDNDQPVRRVARWDDLPPESRPLLAGFIDRRLLVRDNRKSGDVVEVALESLLRQWDDLQKWLSEERKSLKQVEALERSVAGWEANGRDSAWLLEGTRLSDAESLFGRAGFQGRVAPAREFVEESRRREDHRSQEEKTARRRKKVLRTAWVVTGVILVVTALVLFRLMQSSRQATAWRLVSESEQMLKGGRAGGDVRALQQLLAANGLGATAAGAVADTRRDELKIIENPPRNDGVIPVRSVALSPDGRRIASGSDDHTVRLWDADTGDLVHELVVGQNRPAWSVAFSPDGTWIATGSGESTLQLWDADSGAMIGNPIPHRAAVHTVAFSGDSKRIVTGSDDGAVRIWDRATRTELVQQRFGHNWGTPVRSVAFSPAGDLVVSGGDDGTVRLWDARSGGQVAKVGGGSTAMSVAFSPRGDGVVAGRIDGTIEILDARDLQTRVASFKAHPNAVNSVAFSTDGTRIVSAGADNTVRVWDSATHAPIGNPLVGHHGEAMSAMFNHEGTRIVSGGLDGSVREWDAVSGLPIPAGQGQVRVVAFSPDGHRIASAGDDGAVKLWDPTTAKPIGQLEPSDAYQHGDYTHAVNGLAFSPDDSRIASGGNDGLVRVWDVATGQVSVLPNVDPHTLPPAKDHRIKSVAFSSDGSRIVSGGNDCAVRVWDAQSLQSLGVICAHTVDDQGKPAPYPVWSVALSPDGRHIASGSGGYDNSLQLWDVATLTADGPPMVGHPGWNIFSVAFSPDSKRIVSGSYDGTTRVWNVANREQVAQMNGDQNSVLSVAFAHAHPWIVSGGADGTVRLWDSDNYQPIGMPLEGHRHWVTSVAFSPDDTEILSGSWDGSLHLWSAPKGLADVVCGKINSNMSPQQWDHWVSRWIKYNRVCPSLPIAPDNG